MHDDHRVAQLRQDLKALTTFDRRQALRWLAGAALVPFLPSLGCDDGGTTVKADAGGDGDAGDGSSGADTSTGDGAAVTCDGTAIPEETAGPYPGDGSNGVNALTLSGIVRRDIRTSVGSASGTAAGIELTVRLTLVDRDCSPLAGHAVYLWHCTNDGEYSLYTLTTENYLRGVQASDASGVVEFTTIFPGCYSGRWPHIHFEVYPDLASANAAGNKIATSQLALPQAACADVYATSGYEASVANLAGTSLASDNVFSDGVDAQLATVTGSVADGYVASLVVVVDV